MARLTSSMPDQVVRKISLGADRRGCSGPPDAAHLAVHPGARGQGREEPASLDVSPIDGSTEDEVTRLLGLGATRTDVGQGSDRNWEVMADPEGNEFCVLRTLAPQD